MVSKTATGVACVASAALLVVGMDYVSLAANGTSLLLGRHNDASRTTTVEKGAPGPVLSLLSVGNQRPSLRVSSKARVARLNADMVDGKDARVLSSRATTFEAGTTGQVYSGFAAWSMPVEPGPYQVSFLAAITSTVQDGQLFEVICGVADLETIGSNRPVVYTAESGVNSAVGAPTLLSGADAVRVRKDATPGVLCIRPTDGGEFSFPRAITVSWTRLNHRDKATATGVTIPLSRRSAFLAPPAR